MNNLPPRTRQVIATLARLLLLFSLTAASMGGHAQKAAKGTAVTGNVKALKTDLPIEFAAVSLLRAQDSTAVINSLTNKAGDFALPGVADGSYVLKVSFVGFKAQKRSVIVSGGKAVNAGIFSLDEGIVLEAVKVEGEVMPVKVSGDTTTFNTGAYKAPPDATLEDGLKKIPTIEIDKDGNIKSNGDDIKKLTVDGKPFFGNDPKLATRNLPYDAIKNVKVIEEKSEKAKATGVDDGIRVKTLDVTLKDDKKKGWFGSASGAGGTEDRYLGSASINRFTPDKQYNALLLTNNVNQVGFSTDEASNFGNSGISSYTSVSSGGGVITSMNGVAIGNATQGLATTSSGGLNYGTSFGKKNKVNVSTNYFYGRNSSLLVSDRNTQQTMPDTSIYFTKSNNYSDTRGQSHKVNFTANGRIDSLTSINMNPSLTVTLSNSASNSASAQSRFSSPTNATSSQSVNKMVRPALNGNMSINRSLHNKKGNMSIYLYGNYNPSSTESTIQSENNFFGSRPSVLINRMENRDGTYAYLDASFTYNRTVKNKTKEGKGTSFSWSLSPTYDLNVSNNDNDVLEYDPSTGLYNLRLDSLSNRSTSVETRIGSGTGISLGHGKWTLSLNNSMTNIHLTGGILGNKLDENVSKNYFSSEPSASFTYSIKSTRRLQLSSSYYNTTPSISNLILKQNNTSPLYIRQGNPDLKMSSQLSTSVRYNSSNVTSVAAKRTSTSLSVSYSQYFNSSTSQSFIDDITGITTSRPINISGNYSMSANGSLSLPSFFKELRLAPGFNFRNNKNIGFYNGLENISRSTTYGGNLTVNFANKETLTLYASNRTSFTNVRNTSRPGNSYYSTDNSATINAQPVKKWRIVGDITHRYTGVKGFVLLNAGLQHYMMQNNKILLELRGFDLLNKNTDVIRQQYDTQISDIRNNNIGQYFYLKLTYKVNKIGSSSKSVPAPSVMIVR